MNLLTEQNATRVKVGLYGGLVFFSFFTIVAIPITTNNLNGCPLYYDKVLGSDANCSYPVAVSVLCQLLYGIFRLATLILLLLGTLQPESFLFSDFWQLFYTAVDVVAWFLVFVSACIISVGIHVMCNFLAPLTSCSNSYFVADHSAVSRLRTAEAGAWISVVLWLVLMAGGLLWLFRQGKIPCFHRTQQSGQSSAGKDNTAGQQVEESGATEAKY